VKHYTNEVYYRLADPTQQDDRSTAPIPDEQPIVDRFSLIAADHAITLRMQTGKTPADDMDNTVKACVETLGYR